MTVPESAVATESLSSQPCPEDMMMVAFNHESGGLLVRIWEEECADPSLCEEGAN
jgi:hypothetical protein